MYQCPSCGAGLAFNPKNQLLECKYCKSTFKPEEIKEIHFKDAKGEKDIIAEATKKEEVKDNEYEAILYRCSQCGAELITTDETIATFCSYCGSSAVLERKYTKKQKPNYIIPFTKTKEECENAYKRKLHSAFFAPSNMLKTQQVEKIRGIYMPYWLYSFDKDGECISSGEKYHKRVGDYVYYKDYRLTANIKAKCSGISHDATSNFADNLSEAIAPYNMNDKKEFSPTYLSGFYADSEDVNSQTYERECNEIANKEISKELMKNDKTYSKYNSKPNVLLNTQSTELGLFPVYFLATRNKKGDRISYAVMNGQTGKVAAEIPIDFKKYLITSLLLAVPIFLLLNAFFTFTPGKVLIISIIFSILSLIMSAKQLNDINKREKRLDDKGFINKNSDSKQKSKVKKEKIKFFPKLIKPIIGLLLAIAILVLNPVSDVYYYAGAIASIVLVICSFADLLKEYNLLTTRKLPQLEKRGGDENA